MEKEEQKMEKEQKKKQKINWGKYLVWGLAAIGFYAAYREKERADRYEGEIINLRRINKGQQKTINILNYNKGKDSMLND